MRNVKPYILLSPMLILTAVFLSGIANALIQSVGYIPAFDLTDFTLKYYIEILQNPVFLSSVKVSLFISLVSSVAALVLGVLICAALVNAKKGREKAVNIVRLPIFIPHTVVAIFVIALLSQSGLFARFLFHAGLISSQDAFPKLLYNAGGSGIIIAYIWKEAPFVAYFVYALMKSIDATFGEAAATLGACPARAFFAVTLPLSMPAVFNAFIIIFAYSFGAYELPFLLGATSPKALPVLAYIEYMHPDLRHRPYAMAMNGIILLLSMSMALAYFILLQRKSRGMGGS